MEFVLEGLVILFCVLLGWLHVRQNRMEKKLDEKADKGSIQKLEDSLSQILEKVTDLRVDNAKWQVLVDKALSSK